MRESRKDGSIRRKEYAVACSWLTSVALRRVFVFTRVLVRLISSCFREQIKAQRFIFSWQDVVPTIPFGRDAVQESIVSMVSQPQRPKKKAAGKYPGVHLENRYDRDGILRPVRYNGEIVSHCRNRCQTRLGRDAVRRCKGAS